MMQPRLQFALAKDGLLPRMFSDIDTHGNPRKGALVAGFIMTVFATFVPFADLDDFISAGILFAFTLTNSSLILMRHKSPESDPALLGKLLAKFNIVAFSTCLVLTYGLHLIIGCISATLLGILCAYYVIVIRKQCPQRSSFAGVTTEFDNVPYFTTPFVPAIPCIGIFVNYILVSQLSFFGIGLIVLYILLLTVCYFCYGAKHSVARRDGWARRESLSVELNEPNGSVEMN